MEEHEFQCPYCWETISMLLDSSQSEQEYIEDCEVCCNPIQISVKFQAQELVSFRVESIEQ
ncbi:CPXCG motif-containing cysteine-rich protein [Xanthomarina sp.]|uniref:CPXCG motif-containing cysteine-rich protein n=1 Tax=Xanthomarina sp. TaxID=1931211 RepID=UPI002B52421E|nr:CPXCG motif-containing cysteine-rich protein [Xanthomarina sp.]HLV38274.1 CPXCG motif-containing cysteine-rich protein [Xanthomarina sp.]